MSFVLTALAMHFEQFMSSDSNFMSWGDIQACSDAWLHSSGALGSPFDEYRGKALPLPEWWTDFDPWSAQYAQQMDLMWQTITDCPQSYQPTIHEITDDRHVDAIYKPGIYSSGDVAQGGNMLITTGHVLQHAGISPRSRIIEYGAGWGMNAVTMARFGCEVHTVDIDDTFCTAVTAQARHLNLNLTAHRKEFGYNPGGQFDLILFEASFHHSRHWTNLIPVLRNILSPNGKIILTSEPIHVPEVHGNEANWLPYPWGIRLDAEVVAIMRHRKWYELGFRQDFLVNAFQRLGFTYTYRHCPLTHYADIHEFNLAPT